MFGIAAGFLRPCKLLVLDQQLDQEQPPQILAGSRPHGIAKFDLRLVAAALGQQNLHELNSLQEVIGIGCNAFAGQFERSSKSRLRKAPE